MAARKFLTPIDMTLLEIRNQIGHLLASDPGSPVEGQLYYNTTTHTLEVYNGTAFLSGGAKLNQVDAPAADVAMAGFKITGLGAPAAGGDASTKTYVDGQTLNGIATRTASTADITVSGFKVTNLGTPTAGTDAVTKTYADSLVAGVSSWKTAVRAATTANGTLATAYENGDTIDGVTLATGDRILLKNQTTGGENGIYVVAASGAPARSTDADAGTELVAAGVFVDEGTVNADSSWINTTNGPITLGTTATVWVQFSGAGQITSGAGLTKTGNTLDVGAGNGITVAADSILIDTTVTADLTTTQTLSGKTLTSPVLNTGVSGSAVIATAGFGASSSDTAIPTVLAVKNAMQPLDADLTTIAGLTATTDNMIQSVAGAWASRTPAQVKTALALTIGTNVQAWDADLDTIAGLTATTDSFIQAKAGAWSARTIAQVKTDLGVVSKVSADCAAATTTVVTHNFGTLDVIVQVYVTGTTGAMVDCDIQHTTTNTVTVVFAVAPTAAQYRITCIG